MRERLTRYIKDIFSIDIRALAFLRIALGSIILIDLVIGIGFIVPFHTDVGVLPLDILLQNFESENLRTIHSINNSYTYQLILHIIHISIAVVFILGWKTKLFTFLMWFFWMSFLGHNPLIINGSDIVVKVLLFWGFFLPLGSRRSIDAGKEGSPKQPYKVFSLASLAFILQLLAIYIFTVELKDHPKRHTEFTSVYYALSLDTFRTAFGDLIYKHRDLMIAITAFSYYLEAFGWTLALSPLKNKWTRTFCVFLFCMFHIGLGLSMRLTIFPRVMCLFWITLLPPYFRNRCENLLSKTKQDISKNLPQPQIIIKKTTLVTTCFLLFSMTYIFMRNLRATDFDKYTPYFPTHINRFGFLFRLDQYRNMFSPFPFMDDGRTVIIGTDKDGKEYDMRFLDKTPSTKKPDDFGSLYGHERRRKYFTALRMKKNSKYRRHTIDYLCYNAQKKGIQIETVKWLYVLERTLADYKTEPVEEVVLFQGNCVEYGEIQFVN